MEDQLKKYFSRYALLSEPELNMLVSVTEYKPYERREHLLEQGAVCRCQPGTSQQHPKNVSLFIS